MLFRNSNICLDKCNSNYECSGGQTCYNQVCSITTTTTTTTTTTPALPAGCENYKFRTNPKRNKSYATPLGQAKCDRSGYTYISPDWQGPGWYRISPSIGTKIPTSSMNFNQCGTQASGWISAGSTPEMGQTINAKACFVEPGKHTLKHCSYSTNIKIRNCEQFFLYYLIDTPFCNLGYCVE